MIDLSKKYRTRNGRAVTLFTTEAKGHFNVVGQTEDDFELHAWTSKGRYDEEIRTSMDLIEISPSEELLEEAKRRYPEGTNCIPLPPFFEKKIRTCSGDYVITAWGIKDIKLDQYIYLDGQWAEIVKTHKVKVLLYESQDGPPVAKSESIFCMSKVIAIKEIEFFEGEGLSPNQK